MSAALIAAHKLQADLAGLTGMPMKFVTVAKTATEHVSELFQGESGSLHYLWSSVPVPVAQGRDAQVNDGWHGGAGHPNVGGAPMARPPASPASAGATAIPYPVYQGAEMPAGHGGLGGLYA